MRLSLCGGAINEDDMHKIIQVFQDSFEVICVGMNDNHFFPVRIS